MLHAPLAATGLVICIVLAVHMALPRRHRLRMDAGLAALLAWLRLQGVRLAGWRHRQQRTRSAALAAERAIRRARESALHDARDSRSHGEWEGNVYRPKRFEKPKKPH